MPMNNGQNRPNCPTYICMSILLLPIFGNILVIYIYCLYVTHVKLYKMLLYSLLQYLIYMTQTYVILHSKLLINGRNSSGEDH